MVERKHAFSHLSTDGTFCLHGGVIFLAKPKDSSTAHKHNTERSQKCAPNMIDQIKFMEEYAFKMKEERVCNTCRS